MATNTHITPKSSRPASIHYYNMDIVRYYLAISVILSHLNALTGLNIPWPTPGTIRVGAFFAISGFLVYPSFFRKSGIRQYFKTRAYRIIPSYSTVILFFAIVLVVFSTLPALEYFTNPQFWKYLFWNLLTLNFVCPSLPGVFTGDEFVIDSVNGSMWTMKVEWLMYFSVPIVAWVHRKIKDPHNFLLLGIFIASIIYRLAMFHMRMRTGNDIFEVLDRQAFGQMCYFYGGAYIYFNKEKIIKYKWPVIGCALTLWCLEGYIPYYFLILKPAIVSLVVLWVCMVGNWGKIFGRHDNISYDLYLYHYPLVQIGICLGLKSWSTPLILLYTLGLTLVFALLSWNLVGKRFKRLTRYASQKDW